MAARLSTEELAAALGRASAGRCTACAGSRAARRGSPARSTWRRPAAATRPLILQMDRGGGAPGRAGCGSRAPCSMRPAPPACRCPPCRGRRRGPGPRRRGSGRLAGGRAPRGRDDPAQDPARPRVGRRPPRPDRPVRRAPSPPSTPSTRRRSRASPRPTRCATRCPCSMRSARSAPRSSSACAGWPRTARRPDRGSRCTATSGWATCWSGPTACAASSTGSSPTPATRPRTSAGSARRPGASAAPARSAASVRSPSCSPPTRRRAVRPCRPDRVHWWQVYATVKWAAICALQASAHLSGATRSVELAAIGRRVCESEWDLFVLLGTPPPADLPEPARRPDRWRPSAARRRPSWSRRCASTSRASWSAARAAPASRRAWPATPSGIVERELAFGPALAAAHAARLAALGYADDAALAAAVRAGDLDDDWESVASGLAAVGPRPAAGGEPLLLAAGHGVGR